MLPPGLDAAGYRLLALEATGSTNDDAARAARDGDSGRLWIVAGSQEAGRGRHGRHWLSPAGNLYASLLLVDPCPPALAPQLGFIAGLALHEAVERATGLAAPRLALKWPNDLLLEGAKVAGILLEAESRQGFTVVIGFGVNIARRPEDTPYPSAALAQHAPAVSAATLFPELAKLFARRFESWQDGLQRGAEPFAAIREQWLARAAGRGASISVRLPGCEKRGTFAGLDPSGRLELQTTRGLELIDAGDLYFPVPPRSAALSAS